MRRKAITAHWAVAQWAVLLLLFLAVKVSAAENDLVISEIMYNVAGSDSGQEWIEIYNSGSEDLLVNSTWRFFDNSSHSLNLYQGTSTISAAEYFILADNAQNFLAQYPDYNATLFDTVMSLPNTSSSIALSFDAGLTYPVAASYDASWGADGNGFSLEKLNDNWQESCQPGGSPGEENIECQADVPPEDEPEINRWSQVLISEFLPNPIGSDEGEWIELYNVGPETVNLSGLGLSDNTSRIFVLSNDDFSNLELLAGEYFLLYKNISGISLNNSGGDSVKIYDSQKNLLEAVSYSGSALEGRSYARENNNFYWTKTPSPGASNQISHNQKPIVQISVEASSFYPKDKISFSAENSYDPENDDLDFAWDFGDGNSGNKVRIKHAYENPGSYRVVLIASDSEGASSEASYNLIINIKPEEEDKKEEEKKKEVFQGVIIDFEIDDLFISEFIPNPVGSDDNEWVELYNARDKNINLSGWQLDDADGGSKPYIFSTTTIEANKFLLVNKKESKLSLNNSSDSVRLLTPSGELWQEVVYEKIPEGKSYAWDFENYEWYISDPTPGMKNLYIKEQEIVYDVYQIKDLDKNQKILVQGIVLNKPDENGRSIYLADYSNGLVNFDQVLEVYCYYKDFPALSRGDLITVSGELLSVAGLPRLKIKSAQDIVASGIKIVLKNPEPLMADSIEADFVGQFLTVKGTVVKKSGKNIYVADDLENESNVRVYANFSLGDLEIKKGTEIIASGILTQTENNFKLLPFDLAGISVSQEVLGEKISSIEVEQDIASSTNYVGEGDRSVKVKNILLFIFAGLLIIGTTYFLKRKHNASS